MSSSQKLEDISSMTENLNLTSSQEDNLLAMETDGEGGSVNEPMEVTVINTETPDGSKKVDTFEVLTDDEPTGDGEGDVESSAEPTSSEVKGTDGGTTEPDALNKRQRNRRRQRQNNAKRLEKERAAASSEHLLPLLTPKRGREVEDTPQVESGVPKRL